MGLDLIAVSKLSPLEDGKTSEWSIEITSGERVDRQPGRYTVNGEYLSKRIGSYSTYNIVRNIISRVTIGESAEVVWSTRDYKGHGAGYLVDFSDCDGILDSYYCQHIAKDLTTHKQQLIEALMEEFDPDNDSFDYYNEYVSDIITLFEVGSDNGCVIFS